MNTNAINVRTFAIGAVVLGLVVGTGLGFANIATTQVTKADEQPEASIALGQINRNPSQEKIASAQGVAAASAKSLHGKDVSLNFIEAAANPYIAEKDAKGTELLKKGMLSFIDAEGYAYWIDDATDKVVQVGPAARTKESDPNPSASYDFTDRYTKDTLLPVALKAAVAFGADPSSLQGKPQITTKDGRAFFYRWEDSSSTDENMRFVQIGMTIGGTLLSYTNTLGI